MYCFFWGVAIQKQLIILETNAQMQTLLTQIVNTKKFLMMILVGTLPTQDLMQTIAFANANILFNEEALPDGTLIGVFYTNDDNDYACGGYQVIDANESNISCMGL